MFTFNVFFKIQVFLNYLNKSQFSHEVLKLFIEQKSLLLKENPQRTYFHKNECSQQKID